MEGWCWCLMGYLKDAVEAAILVLVMGAITTAMIVSNSNI